MTGKPDREAVKWLGDRIVVALMLGVGSREVGRVSLLMDILI